MSLAPARSRQAKGSGGLVQDYACCRRRLARANRDGLTLTRGPGSPRPARCSEGWRCPGFDLLGRTARRISLVSRHPQTEPRGPFGGYPGREQVARDVERPGRWRAHGARVSDARRSQHPGARKRTSSVHADLSTVGDELSGQALDSASTCLRLIAESPRDYPHGYKSRSTE